MTECTLIASAAIASIAIAFTRRYATSSVSKRFA
jgi:hypothetical protein